MRGKRASRVVAIVRANGERQVVKDHFHLAEIARVELARDAEEHFGFPVELLLAIPDALAEMTSERQRDRAKGPRVGRPRAELESFRDKYIAEIGHRRGWVKAAAREFSCSVETIRRRMRIAA